MKQFYLLLLAAAFCFSVKTKAQVSINDSASLPAPSAMLDVKSTTKGVLLPRMTMAERNLITTPDEGLLIFQTDNTPGFYYFNGSTWQAVSRTPQPHQQFFLAPGTFTFTTSANITAQTVFKATITAGGGGGGGQIFSIENIGGGGGGGETLVAWMSGLTPSTTYTVNVGSGGFSGFGIGGDGSNSSFNGYNAVGGGGGDFNFSFVSGFGPGGIGGLSPFVPPGALQFPGGMGGLGTVPSFTTYAAGEGGSSYYGAGGNGATANGPVTTNAATGIGYGTGSGGCLSSPFPFPIMSADGQSGAVIIEWTE